MVITLTGKCPDEKYGQGNFAHGMVNGQGRLEVSDLDTLGRIGNKVLDYSNGNKATIRKGSHYVYRVNPNEWASRQEVVQFMLLEVTWTMGDVWGYCDGRRYSDSKGEIGKKKVKHQKIL